MEHAANKTDWLHAQLDHARAHLITALGLALALAVVMLLLAKKLYHVWLGDAAPGLRLALLGGLAGFATTVIGAGVARFTAEH